MKLTRTITALGALGPMLLVILWVSSKFFARELDDVLRPYGLFIVLGIFVASVLLPTIAALRSSKWWFLVVAACLAIVLFFYDRLMA